MIQQEQIAKTMDAQNSLFLNRSTSFPRQILSSIPIISHYATIITGIRRCGKSTLLLQVLNKNFQNAIYLNFEDIRLAGFDFSDFTRLHNEIMARQIKVLFFDEIQLIPKWELFINQLNREDYQVFITGSNASLLSKELGTHLTGRHISTELFPFSYQEFIAFKDLHNDCDSLKQYLITGGIPEYVKNNLGILLTSLVDDIIVRDIAIRHNLRDIESLRQLVIYLISNVGNLVSANKLVGLFGIKSGATFLEYFSYLKDAYLIEFVSQFSYSIKAQQRNPKKIYAIDTGLITEISGSFSEDLGQRFENLVYLHLRRMSNEIYFFKEKGECDFVVLKQNKVKYVIQVCYQLDDLNFNREYNGLLEAMNFFKLSNGYIVTLNQTDKFEQDDKTIHVIPAHEFLTNPLYE